MKKTPWPHGFALTPELCNYALRHGFKPEHLDYEWECFENHHRAKGSVFADWVRAWYTWVLRSHNFRPAKSATIERMGVSPQDQLDFWRAKGVWPQ